MSELNLLAFRGAERTRKRKRKKNIFWLFGDVFPRHFSTSLAK
jgi:hypothetical protein